MDAILRDRARGCAVGAAVGELGYWPVGSAFCIFFGPTPVSTGVEPRAYSPVNILGRVLGDATRFRDVRSGVSVRLARAEGPADRSG